MRELPYIAYKAGDAVRITSGAFSDFTGKVEEVNEYAPILQVKVAIFGRATYVELNFLDVEKAELAELKNWWNKGNRNN
jgi:transcriptional antiterminator NusG